MYNKPDTSDNNDSMKSMRLKSAPELPLMFEWVTASSGEQMAESKEVVLTEIEAHLNDYYQSVSQREDFGNTKIRIRWVLSSVSMNDCLIYKFSAFDADGKIRGGVITPPPPPPPNSANFMTFNSLDEGVMEFSSKPPVTTGGVITPSVPPPPDDN